MARRTANELSEGMYVTVDGEPCRIRKESTSMPGKHGHAKKKLEVEGVFDGKRRTVTYGAHDEVETPDVERNDGQVVSVEGDVVQIMDLDSYETHEVKREDLNLENGDEVIYVASGDRKKIDQVKEE